MATRVPDDASPRNDPSEAAAPRSRGGKARRVVVGIVLAAVIIYVLFTWVFPRIERYMDDPSLTLDAVAAMPNPGWAGPRAA